MTHCVVVTDVYGACDVFYSEVPLIDIVLFSFFSTVYNSGKSSDLKINNIKWSLKIQNWNYI